MKAAYSAHVLHRSVRSAFQPFQAGVSSSGNGAWAEPRTLGSPSRAFSFAAFPEALRLVEAVRRRGLTTRCSGLAALAAELDIVRLVTGSGAISALLPCARGTQAAGSLSSFRRTYLPRLVPSGEQRRPQAACVGSRPSVSSRLSSTSQPTSSRSPIRLAPCFSHGRRNTGRLHCFNRCLVSRLGALRGRFVQSA